MYFDFNRNNDDKINMNFNKDHIQRFLTLLETKSYKKMLIGQIKEQISNYIDKKEYNKIKDLNETMKLANSKSKLKYDKTLLKFIINDMELLEYLCNDEAINLVKKFFNKRFDKVQLAFTPYKIRGAFRMDKLLFECNKFFINNDIKELLIGRWYKQCNYSFIVRRDKNICECYIQNCSNNNWFKLNCKIDVDKVKNVIYNIRPKIYMIEEEDKFHFVNEHGNFIKKDFLTDFDSIKYPLTNFYIIVTDKNKQEHKYLLHTNNKSPFYNYYNVEEKECKKNPSFYIIYLTILFI